MVPVYVGTKEEGRKRWRASGKMMLKGKKHLVQAGSFEGQLLFSISNFLSVMKRLWTLSWRAALSAEGQGTGEKEWYTE